MFSLLKLCYGVYSSGRWSSKMLLHTMFIILLFLLLLQLCILGLVKYLLRKHIHQHVMVFDNNIKNLQRFCFLHTSPSDILIQMLFYLIDYLIFQLYILLPWFLKTHSLAILLIIIPSLSQREWLRWIYNWEVV